MQRGTPCEAELLQRALLPSVLACLHAAAAQIRRTDHTTMLTVLLSPGRTSLLDVRALASPCALLTDGPTWAAVLGGPREVPVGKDTAWVAQRRRLEDARPEGSGEVLLCTREGALLEGLVTNLFVVCSGGEEADAAVVVTAGMADGVVWGTMRQRVLQACEALGLVVEQRAALPAERSSWREAFITSRRVLLPLPLLHRGRGHLLCSRPMPCLCQGVVRRLFSSGHPRQTSPNVLWVQPPRGAAAGANRV